VFTCHSRPNPYKEGYKKFKVEQHPLRGGETPKIGKGEKEKGECEKKVNSWRNNSRSTIKRNSDEPLPCSIF